MRVEDHADPATQGDERMVGGASVTHVEGTKLPAPSRAEDHQGAVARITRRRMGK